MPTYDYICEKCQKTFEFFQSMSDDPIKNCPECNNAVSYTHLTLPTTPYV